MRPDRERRSGPIRLPPTCRWRLARPTFEQLVQGQDWVGCCLGATPGGPSIESPLCLEMDLSEEVYRFAWSSSFDGDLTVKITRSDDGCQVHADRRWLGPDHEPTRRLGPEEWVRLEAAVGAASFWSLEAPDQGLNGLDGADWHIEGRKADLFHSVVRWSPTDPRLVALGSVFAELAGFPDLALY